MINMKLSKKLTKQEVEENIIEWTTFYQLYRRNLDIFTEDFLEIPLKFFQKQLLLGLAENEVEDVMASRGLSKQKKIINYNTKKNYLIKFIILLLYNESYKVISVKIGEVLQ